jgi:hypothetical protein
MSLERAEGEKKVADGESVKAVSIGMRLRSKRQLNEVNVFVLNFGKKNEKKQNKTKETQSTNNSTSQAADNTLGDGSSELPVPSNGNVIPTKIKSTARLGRAPATLSSIDGDFDDAGGDGGEGGRVDNVDGNGRRRPRPMSEQLTTCYCCNYKGNVDNNELTKFNQHKHGIMTFDGNCLGNNQQYPCPLHQDIIALPSELKKIYTTTTSLSLRCH